MGTARKATFGDLGAIMDINGDVYEGLDYLPALFYTFMHSKQHQIDVYEKDNKLLALFNYHFYPDDDGLAATMSTRVRPNFQGSGIAFSNKSPLLKKLLNDHPKMSRYVAYTMLKPNVQAKIHMWKPHYHWNFLFYKLQDRTWIKRCLELEKRTNGFLPPIILSHTTANEWISKNDQLVRFVSNYASDFVPIGPCMTPTRINQAGFRTIFSSSNTLFTFDPPVTSFDHNSCSGSRSSGSNQDRPTDRMKTMKEEESKWYGLGEKEILGFSYSTVIPCKYGLRVDIYFFGDSENILLSHVFRHLLHYVTISKADVKIGCFVHFPLGVNYNSVEERLKERLGNRVVNEYYSVRENIMFTMPVPKSKI